MMQTSTVTTHDARRYEDTNIYEHTLNDPCWPQIKSNVHKVLISWQLDTKNAKNAQVSFSRPDSDYFTD